MSQSNASTPTGNRVKTDSDGDSIFTPTSSSSTPFQVNTNGFMLGGESEMKSSFGRRNLFNSNRSIFGSPQTTPSTNTPDLEINQKTRSIPFLPSSSSTVPFRLPAPATKIFNDEEERLWESIREAQAKDIKSDEEEKVAKHPFYYLFTFCSSVVSIESPNWKNVWNSSSSPMKYPVKSSDDIKEEKNYNNTNFLLYFINPSFLSIMIGEYQTVNNLLQIRKKEGKILISSVTLFHLLKLSPQFPMFSTMVSTQFRRNPINCMIRNYGTSELKSDKEHNAYLYNLAVSRLLTFFDKHYSPFK